MTIARRSAPTAQGQDLLQLACFSVGEEKYGIDIMKIKEVTRYHPVTRLPKAPAFVEGVIDLRGMIIPVADMRKRLDLPVQAPTKRTRVIIAMVGRRILGVIVDDAREVIRIPHTSVKPPPRIGTAVEADYLSGVVEHDHGLIFILDFDKVFSTMDSIRIPTGAAGL